MIIWKYENGIFPGPCAYPYAVFWWQGDKHDGDGSLWKVINILTKKFKCSAVYRRVYWYKVTDVSEDFDVFTLRVILGLSQQVSLKRR